MKATAHHLQSLDAVRGITIAGMIVVNNPGDWVNVFPQLVHSGWAGITCADLVFPAFVFILGFVLPFAFARRLEGGNPIPHLYGRIGRRAASLFVLGLILNAAATFGPLSQLRIPGVLQRLALVYLCASAIVLHTGALGRAAIAVLLLIAHWALLVLVPFSGHAAGTLTPDLNLAAHIDAVVLGGHRLMPTDPEGLLGTMPAVAQALLGALAGQWIRRTRDNSRRAIGMLGAAAAVTIAGALWANILVVSKPLWTGSFALLTAGAAAAAFVLCFVVIDTLHMRAWARPFVWLGVNPLAMYFLSELGGHLLDQPWLRSGSGVTSARAVIFWSWMQPALGRWLSDSGVSLLFAVAYTALWIAVARLFYWRGLRVQV